MRALVHTAILWAVPAHAERSTEQALQTVASLAKCGARRPIEPEWCALGSWSAGTPAALPDAPLFGLEIDLLDASDLPSGAWPVAVVADPTVSTVRVELAFPDDDITRDIAALRKDLRNASVRAVPVAFRDLDSSSILPVSVQRDDQGWFWSTSSFHYKLQDELRKVGARWVLVERGEAHVRIAVLVPLASPRLDRSRK
jgi:hypothetical protein